MKILITGSSGFIGKNMVKALESKHDVFTYDWHQTYPDLDNLDWVIHLGAISSTTENRIHYILRQNLESSIYLYEDCINRNINFQFASSASVYGLQSGFKETCPLKPLNHYAISKAMFERYVELRNAPITTQIFRYFNVYGPDEEHKGNQASPQTKFLIQAKQNKTINIFEGSDKFKRDFIHVDKIVDYHQKFFNIKESGVWNFGTGTTKSFLEVAKEVSNKTGAKIKYIKFPKNLNSTYQKYTKADTKKLKDTLNFT